MCGVLQLVPPVRSAPSSMSARASLSVKLSSWYRLFPSRVSLQRGGQYYHQLSQLESVASPRTMPPTQWKLPISIEELMEKKTIVLSAYVLCRIS